MKIIRDTREQYGFCFALSGHEVITKKLDSGDYSIEGLENQVSIERKRNTGELYANLVQKKGYERFKKEMGRLSEYSHRWIVCEFPQSFLYEFPKNSGIPEFRWKYVKACAALLRKRIYEIQEEFNIEFIFCQNDYEAEKKSLELLREAYADLHNDI